MNRSDVRGQWTRKDTIALLSVLFAALIIRVTFVLFVHPVPISDFGWYYGRALAIVHGLGYSVKGAPTAFFPPGWPFFLAGVIQVFGPSVAVAEVVQATLGALTAGLVFLIGRIVGGRSAGIAGGAAFALLPSSVEWSAVLASEPLYTFLWALATYIWVRCSTRQLGWYALSGLILGATALVRPSALLFWIILFAYLVTLKSERKHWPRLIAAVAVTAVCTFVVVTPWIVRDYNVYHTLVVVSNNGGTSLYQANNAHSNPAYTELDNPQIAKLLGDPRTEAAGDELAEQLAITYMKTHVPRELLLSVLKAKALYSRDDSVISYSFAKTSPPANNRTVRFVFLLNTIAYYTLMLFALLGIVLCFVTRRDEEHPQWRLVLGMTLYNTLIFSLVGGIDRFRYPTMPYFSIFAGIGIVAALAYLRSRARSRREKSAQPLPTT